jgi:hypothetical protein
MTRRVDGAPPARPDLNRERYKDQADTTPDCEAPAGDTDPGARPYNLNAVPGRCHWR